MKEYIGKIQIEDKVYTANFRTDLRSTFTVKLLDFPFHQYKKIDIAIGFFENLGKITLVSGFLSSGSFGNLGIQIFDFSYLIKGENFFQLEDIQANILNFESEILKEVFTDSVISLDGITNDLDRNPITLLHTSHLKINYYNGLRTNYTRQMEFKAFQYKFLHFRTYGNSVPIWDLLQLAGRFKKMIFLLGFQDAEKEDEYTFVLYRNRVKKRFQLFGWDYKIARMKFNIFTNYHISFNDFFDSSQIERWLFCEEYQKLFDMLYERHFLKQISAENSFLNAIYALERLHRNFVLKECTLEKRIKYFKQIFEEILPKETNVATYLNKILQTRHSLSHFDDKKNIFEGIEMLYASVYLEAVVVISLLKDLDLEENKIAKMTKFTKEMINEMYVNNKELQFDYPSELFLNKNQIKWQHSSKT